MAPTINIIHLASFMFYLKSIRPCINFRKEEGEAFFKISVMINISIALIMYQTLK